MKRRFPPFALAALLVAVPAFGVNLGGTLKFSLGGFYNSSNILDLPQQFEGKIEGVVGDPAFPDARYQVKVRARTKPFADGSLFPTSIGGPPQLSIYAMGLHVGRAIAAK